VLCDRDSDGVASAAELVHSAGGTAEPLVIDLTDIHAMSGAVLELPSRLGQLDGLVHAAGVDAQAPFLDVTEEEYDRVMAINLRAAFFLVQTAGKAMAESGGAIVLFSSVVARSAAPPWAVYAMAKTGIISLTWSAAAALGPDIRVNAVCPGLIETPMMARVIARKLELGEISQDLRHPEQVFEEELKRTALKRIASADDVARVVSFLLEDAGYVTGQTLNVDGGLWNT
jgi:NAD(P)-dependent dehydrogenase (short-subunit alcohol dehydrogenase family)